jgi:hypothetical protein
MLLIALISVILFPRKTGFSFDSQHSMLHNIIGGIPAFLIVIGSYHSFLALDAFRKARYNAAELSKRFYIASLLLMVSGIIYILLSIDFNTLINFLTGKVHEFNIVGVFQYPLYALLLLALGLYYKHLGKEFSPNFQ